MDFTLFSMNCVVSMFYIIILLSKFSIYHKIFLIGGIHIFSKLNKKLNDYLQLRYKQYLLDKKLTDIYVVDGKTHFYSMPSGHAQYIAFFTGLLYLFYAKSNNSIGGGYHFLLIIISIIYVYKFIDCIIYGYHTPLQYVVGTIIGGLASFVAFFVLMKCINQ
jgi:membrane-associated phospholipid phosphatase